jgi:hypothetical protein
MKFLQVNGGWKRHLVTVLCLLCIPAFSGCLLVPFIEAFRQTGATEADRMTLLPPQVKKFTDAVGWGNRTEATSVVVPEYRKEISNQLKKLGEEERIVESKVEDVEWSDSAFAAKVSVKVKFFLVPYYVVKSRVEEQQWVFSMAGGWKLKGRAVADE